jgi:hypothetical protein
MAKKLSELSNLSSVADNDILLLTDVSDTSSSETGTSKKITASNLRSSLGADVGWLTVTPSIDEDDWTLSGLSEIVDGILTIPSGGGENYGTLTGAGLDLWASQSVPMQFKLSFKMRINDLALAASEYVQIESDLYVMDQSLYSPYVRITFDDPLYQIMFAGLWTPSGSSQALTFSEDPSDVWLTVTYSGQSVAGFSMEGAGTLTPETAPTIDFPTTSTTGSYTSIDIDLNETVLRVKPW